MRGLALGLLVAMVSCAVWLWGYGGADQVSRWAATTQRDVQNAMAGSLRALRANEAGALIGLWTLCLTYGFVHAAGPGHGKLVLGGYGLGVRVSLRRLVGLAAAASIAQALAAIVFVTIALSVLGWSREQMTTLADQSMASVSYAMIAGVGLWLMLRGLRKGWRLRQAAHHHHDHDHGNEVCSDCGHAHAPSAEQAAGIKTWRDAVAIITAIAIRPCTGALFLLILTYALDVYWAGVIGVLMMGLGTALLTMIAAIAAVSARESALAQAASARGTAVLMAATELVAGGIVVAISLQLLMRLV